MGTYLDSSDEDEYAFELEAEERPTTEPFVNDVEGLQEKLQEFHWPQSTPFSQTQTVTADAVLVLDDVDDDLERELSFYNQAVAAAKAGIRQLDAEGVAWQRPEDYYAEMVKSDDHMARIKDQLEYEQKRIALAEQRRKAREAKRYAKQVQAARQQEKQTAKKQKTKQVEALRGQRKRMGFGQEFDWDMALDEVHNAEQRPKKTRTKQSTVVKSGKRIYKDARYGRSGGYGPARNRKRNTQDSAGDMSSFRAAPVKKRLGKRRRIGQISKRRSRS